jgi:hypothetical protein
VPYISQPRAFFALANLVPPLTTALLAEATKPERPVLLFEGQESNLLWAAV